MHVDRDALAQTAAQLAAQGVFLGTSSWKYAGWLGSLYTPSRYEYRGRVATSRFEKECLREYAEVFRTVCVDAAYYTFPTERYLTGLAAQVPPDFQFGFKVTDEITVKRFPRLERFGPRAGHPNEHFLDADLFRESFLQPCEAIRPQVGLLMFEFSRFHPGDYARGADFVSDLDRFLGALPTGWPYGVEIRNRSWLVPEYFACLARHGVTHVFNSWEAMPPVNTQMALTGSRTNPRLVAARFLLKPGRRYEEAVTRFQPYDQVREAEPEARAAGAALIAEGQVADPRRKTFLYVNNRLEGNALSTLTAMAALAALSSATPGSPHPQDTPTTTGDLPETTPLDAPRPTRRW